MKTINGEVRFSLRGVLKIILITAIFPDINEIKAYHNCKQKINIIAELLAGRRYGKTKKDILKEISSIKTNKQLEDFVGKIYKKYIYQEDIMNLLRSVWYE